jgi:N utilization substance protein B
VKTPPLRRRTKARELAVQLLYQFDLRGREALDQTEEFLAQEAREPEVAEFARRLIHGTVEHLPQIDRILRNVARNWDLRRMAAIDRNVLRMASFEILFCPDIPPKVAINEAIEIGKKFSTANSGGFINGILDRVRIDAQAAVPPENPAAPAAPIEQGS